jgi:protein-tyrosine phosphatase
LTSPTLLDLHAKFIDLEWQQRNRLLAGTQHQPCTDPNDPPSRFARLTGEAVASRNRYINVEPFAYNRVHLKVQEGVNDYINASPIRLGKRRYIATQGPKDTSVNHFYRMITSELKSPAVIVMLTQTHEAGREKCFQYYPLCASESPLIIPPDEVFQDGFQGAVELESVEFDERTRSEIRRMRLTTVTHENPQGAEMEIQHLLFSGWPDFLVPEGDDREALVELIRLSASITGVTSSLDMPISTNGSAMFTTDLLSTDQDNPRIVHCSAGVGRSGTFIALDYLLSLLHAGQLDHIPDESDPINETVDLLRQQRMMMVQVEQQYCFLYDVLREQFCARLQSLAGGDVEDES